MVQYWHPVATEIHQVSETQLLRFYSSLAIWTQQSMSLFSECCSGDLFFFFFFLMEASSVRWVLINYHFTGLICSCIFGWKYGIKAKECSPTEQSDVKSVHRAPSRGSLASEFTLSFSRPKQKQLGEEVRQWFRLCCVVCVCDLFWPKARKILATATINIMNFLYFSTRMLPKRKIKQNYGGLLLFADSLSRQL